MPLWWTLQPGCALERPLQHNTVSVLLFLWRPSLFCVHVEIHPTFGAETPLELRGSQCVGGHATASVEPVVVPGWGP